MRRFLPDLDPKKRLPPKAWVFDVINSVRPNLIDQLVEHSNRIREQKLASKTNFANFDIVDDDLREELLALEHVSRKQDSLNLCFRKTERPCSLGYDARQANVAVKETPEACFEDDACRVAGLKPPISL